jgi:hypothetical protein
VLTKHRGAAVVLLVVSLLTAAAACLVQDTTGANLELAPVFFGAATATLAVKLSRTRPGGGED